MSLISAVLQLCVLQKNQILPSVNAEQVVNGRAKWKHYANTCQILYLECKPPQRVPYPELVCLTLSQNITFFFPQA